VLKEPCLGLFDSGLNLGIAVDAEITVRDEIRNNDNIRCGGSLGGDLCWSRDRSGFGFEDLDVDRFVNRMARARGCPKSVEDSREAVLESPGHSSYPGGSGRGEFLSRHLRRNGEEPRYRENRLS